jgi:hypothetical protein
MTQPDLARIAAQLALDLHPIGGALQDAATHLAELSDLLPARGDARVEFTELVKVLAYIETLYYLADERLTETAYQLQHRQDVPHSLPLGESEGAEGTIRDNESGAVTPAISNPPKKGDPLSHHDSTPPTLRLVNP